MNDFLITRSDIMKMGLRLDDHTITLVTKVALYQAGKLEQKLFPDAFPDSNTPHCNSYFTVKADEIWQLRKELGY